MVAKGAYGNTPKVPHFILQTHDDVRRFLSALQRKRLRMQDNEFMDKYRQDFVYDAASADLLHDQRCHVLLDAEK